MAKERPDSDKNVVELLARAMENVADIVEVSDRRGRFEYVNKAFEDVTGYTLKEVLGRTPAQILRSGMHDESYYDEMWQTISSGSVWRGRLVSRSKRGNLIYQDVVLTPIRGDSGEITNFVAVKRDRTEVDRMRSQLQQSERLALVGQLAAGVAHEINNPLCYVLANLRFIERELERLQLNNDTQEISDVLREAVDGATRVANIVRDLRTFSVPTEEQPDNVDLHEVLESTIRMLSNEIRHRAHIVRDFGTDSVIAGSQSKISQVLLNALLNAAQAIPTGAAQDNTITVRTVRGSNNTIIVEISDTGCGIPPEILEKIFDPFFSTKPGEGMGLGMWISHNLVSAMGGTLTVDSTVNHGTTVTIVLPRGKIEPRSTAPSPLDISEQRAQILIVDDEIQVCRALTRLLPNHFVTYRTNPTEALELIRSEPFDVILCDIMMPDMSGIDLFETAIGENPAIESRFIFITGGAFSKTVQTFLETTPNPVLRKPFEQDELLHAIAKQCEPD